MSRSLLIAAAAIALLAGCSPTQVPSAGAAAPGAAAADATAQAPAAAGPLAGMDPAAIPEGQNRGKVVQKLDGAGFSYAEVQLVTGQKVWVAGKQIDIKPGAQLEWGQVNVMRDFPSKSLGRTFPEILFVQRWNEIGKAPVELAAHAGPAGAAHAAVGMVPGMAPADGVAAAGPAQAASPDASGGGAVKSVATGGGYSFIEVDQGGGKTTWVAAMQTPMKAGDQVRWQGGMVMNNFTAKSIGKTFEKIVFAQAVSVGK